MHSVLFVLAAWCCSFVPAHGQPFSTEPHSKRLLPRQGARLDRDIPSARATLRCDSAVHSKSSVQLAPTFRSSSTFIDHSTALGPIATPIQAVSTNAQNDNASSGTFSGFATFYFQGGVAGACGVAHSDSDLIVALQTQEYAGGKNCGRSVSITNTANGRQVTATVADMCPGCKTANSLDLSKAAFDAIGDEASGVLDIAWHYAS